MSKKIVVFSLIAFLSACSSNKPIESKGSLSAKQLAENPSCKSGMPAKLINIRKVAAADAASAASLDAHQVGIGLSVDESDAGFIVQDASRATAATNGAIRDGDLILCIAPSEGDAFFQTSQLSLDDLVTLLRGPAGTKVGLKVQRSGTVSDVWVTRSR